MTEQKGKHMSYHYPTRPEIQRAEDVWAALDAHGPMRIWELADAASIMPHRGLNDPTRIHHTRVAVHHARMLFSGPRSRALVCNRSTERYYLTDVQAEMTAYAEQVVSGPVYTGLRTIRSTLEAVPATTKRTKLVKKVVKRLIEDLEDELV